MTVRDDRWSSTDQGQRKTLNIRYRKENCFFDRPMPDFSSHVESLIPMQIRMVYDRPQVIDLPDTLQLQLLKQAEHLQISIESLILQAIHQKLTQTSSTVDALP